MKLAKGRLTSLVEKDERVTEDDLRRLYNSQLSSQGQIGGFLLGALFGGILSAAITKGLDWLLMFNIFSQPVTEGFVIFVITLGLVFATLIGFLGSSMVILSFKVSLLKDYLSARAIITKRQVSKA